MIISLELMFGTFLGIVVPGLFWAWRVSASQRSHGERLKELTLMHLDEDSVFSTKRTNELLEKHMRQEENIHRSNTEALNALNRTIAELTHYIRWLTSEQTGKKAPPFVSK